MENHSPPLSPRTGIARWLDPKPRSFLLASCWVLFIFWCGWWCVSFQRQNLQGVKHFWFEPPLFGGDFYWHIDRAARVWWEGGDPYGDPDYEHMFFYPPLVPRLFGWVNLTSPRTSLMIWLCILATILVAAAWAAVASRRRLGLMDIPPITAIVLLLFSTPVLFAMERGQIDPLSLLFILAAIPLMNRSSTWAQFSAGAILCLAPWIKVYPGLLLVALVGLRQWRALAGFVAAGIVLGLVDLGGLAGFIRNDIFLIRYMQDLARMCPSPCPWTHPLGLTLGSLANGTRWSSLAGPLGTVGAAAILLPPLIWVTWHVYRCPRRAELSYPYMLWIVALATFVPQVSNDYNLCFLPLAVLAVWDRRDPLLVHVAVALLLLWWQPLSMSIDPKLLLLCKLLGLGAATVCLVERAREQSQLAELGQVRFS